MTQKPAITVPMLCAREATMDSNAPAQHGDRDGPFLSPQFGDLAEGRTQNDGPHLCEVGEADGLGL